MGVDVGTWNLELGEERGGDIAWNLEGGFEIVKPRIVVGGWNSQT